MLIEQLASEIYIDEGSPQNTSIAAISFWIRGQIGRINSLLCETFCIDQNSLEINGGMYGFNINAAAIIKQLYRLYSLQLSFNNNLSCIYKDGLISVEDVFGGSNFTKINKNEVGKTLLTMRKQEQEILDQLIGAYKINRSIPAQVAGNDTLHGEIYESQYYSLRNV